jgi:organic hydroperoxide reductase OsmC/OhrA
MALELRAACERCARELAPASVDAWICSYECTFCTTCAAELERACPNCSGELVRRPKRGALTPPVRVQRPGARVAWTGNAGSGTASYRAYERSHAITGGERSAIAGSADPIFRGDAARWSPEDLQVAALAACHMLWYLHLCAQDGVIVTAYQDDATSTLLVERGGEGRVGRVLLRPRAMIAAGSDPQHAATLHAAAHEHCFIANASSIPVAIEPQITVQPASR